MNIKLVGKIKDAHSLKGEVYLIVFSESWEWIDDVKSITLKASEDDDSKIFHVEYFSPHKEGLIMKLKESNNRNFAESLKGYLFYLPEEVFISEEGETIYLSEILGFSVVTTKEIGSVIDFSSNGVQDILVVKTEKGPRDILFIKDFIRKIDYDNKKIWMELPAGLLDINDKNYGGKE